MTMRERHGLTALTEKEKQTLRLIVRGHDAKSVAQQLDLSVHTINERLRDARRKLSVSSSREAVRMLLDAEGGAIASPPPEYMGDRRIGEAPPQPMTDESRAPVVGVGHGIRRPDQGRWAESYRLTTSSFRKLNTEQVWAATSEKVRTPLGRMVSRTLLSQDDIPAPPAGYRMVRFNTRFGTSADIVETLTLEREDGAWRVAGIYVG